MLDQSDLSTKTDRHSRPFDKVRPIRQDRLMRFADILTILAAHKGESTWRELAGQTGIHYDTIARIARGDFKNPGIVSVEKIGDALAQMFPVEAQALMRPKAPRKPARVVARKPGRPVPRKAAAAAPRKAARAAA